jgi:uncharacterized protein (UPF0303 family)
MQVSWVPQALRSLLWRALADRCVPAVHGGGVPVRVKAVEGIVAVIVVSGLKQDQDHQVVVEALESFQQSVSSK